MSHLFSYWTFHKSITRLCWTTSTSSLLHCVCKGALWNPCNSRRRNQNLFPPQYSRMFSFLDIHQNLRSWHRIFDLDIEFLTPWDLIQWMLNCLEWLDVRIGKYCLCIWRTLISYVLHPQKLHTSLWAAERHVWKFLVKKSSTEVIQYLPTIFCWWSQWSQSYFWYSKEHVDSWVSGLDCEKTASWALVMAREHR